VADVVEIILALRNVSQFVSGAHQASGAIGQVGTESETAGKKAASGWKGLAKWAGGATAIYGATRYIKGAVSATEDLAKSTITVSRTTGMDTETSSEWAALMKERGVSTRQFQTSLVKLSKTMEASRTGTAKESSTVAALRAQIDAVSAAGGKKAPAEIEKLSRAISKAQDAGLKARKVLDQLGVSQRDVTKGNTAGVLYKVADALKQMRNPAQRAALMQQLFGRSGIALLPILMKGREGVRKLLDEQKAAGNYISGKGLKSAKDLIQQQRELETAFSGVKVQLGQALLPVLVQVGRVLVGFMKLIRPLTKNALLFKVAIALLTAAFLAYKVAVIISTIAQLGLDAAMLPIIGIVVGIVAAIALLTIGIYELWKHCRWFREGVTAAWGAAKVAFGKILDALKTVWSWVKANWPYLVGALAGPFGLAAAAIYKHFGAIKQFALGVAGAIKQAFSTVGGAIKQSVLGGVSAVRSAVESLVRYIESIPDKVTGVLKKIPGAGIVTKGVGAVTGLFHRQHGGPVPAGGVAVVGERGPELVTARTALTVTPVPAVEAAGGPGGPLRPLEIVVPVVLDGREVARSVARVAANQLARA
jgi:hypothetical protein